MKDPITSSVLPGVRCKRCLCCDAEIVVFGEALCAACDDGTHAPLDGQRPVEPQPATPQEPIKEEPMSRVTEKQKEQIVAADPDESSRALGERIGLPGSTADYWRIKLRGGPKVTRLEKSKNCKPAKAAAAQLSSHKDTDLAISRTATVSLSISERSINAWFAALQLNEKAALFTANYKFRIEGTIS